MKPATGVVGDVLDAVRQLCLPPALTRTATRAEQTVEENQPSLESESYHGEFRVTVRRERESVKRALAKHGLSYGAGGRIFGGAVSLPTKSLDALIRERNVPEIEKEFQRALENVEADPAAAVTAACAIVESTCKAYIAEEGLLMPADQSVQPLWKAVQAHLNLDPAKHTDTELRQMLSGLTSIVHGVGGLRTRRGSAHGQGPGGGAIEPRHARLAVHAAHSLVAFVLESWKPK